MEERHQRNIPAISPEEQELLRGKRVLIVGCGGLGGYLLEYLVRIGVGELTVVDDDVFEPSNLNRQLFSSMSVLGQSKVQEAKKRAQDIDPGVCVTAVESFFSAENADDLMRGQDLALDALDNLEGRLLLEDTCARHGVPLVHGAIQGWSAQVALSLPGSNTLHQLYRRWSGGASKTSLPVSAALCAAIQAAEAIRFLCGRDPTLAGKLLLADLSRMDWTILSL